MEHNDKIKKAFWITEDMDREIDAHLKLDNCSSRSEFVMNALKFYSSDIFYCCRTHFLKRR